MLKHTTLNISTAPRVDIESGFRRDPGSIADPKPGIDAEKHEASEDAIAHASAIRREETLKIDKFALGKWGPLARLLLARVRRTNGSLNTAAAEDVFYSL
jgi:hypothetical protein